MVLEPIPVWERGSVFVVVLAEVGLVCASVVSGGL